MSDRKLCAHRIEKWNDASKRAERLACVEDYLLAITTYSAACRRWPEAHITLRRGKGVIEDNRQKPAPDCVFILLALSQQQPHGLYGNHQRHGDNGHVRPGQGPQAKTSVSWYPHPLDNPAID